jgi:hypothetical protein
MNEKYHSTQQIAINTIVKPSKFKNLPPQPTHTPNPNNSTIAIEQYKKLTKIYAYYFQT